MPALCWVTTGSTPRVTAPASLPPSWHASALLWVAVAVRVAWVVLRIQGQVRRVSLVGTASLLRQPVNLAAFGGQEQAVSGKADAFELAGGHGDDLRRQ